MAGIHECCLHPRHQRHAGPPCISADWISGGPLEPETEGRTTSLSANRGRCVTLGGSSHRSVFPFPRLGDGIDITLGSSDNRNIMAERLPSCVTDQLRPTPVLRSQPIWQFPPSQQHGGGTPERPDPSTGGPSSANTLPAGQ